MKHKRPVIPIEPEPADVLLDRISLVLLVLLFIIPIISYTGLPDLIPMRFGHDGQVTSHSGRAAIWALPFTGLFIFVMMHFLNKAPHTFNYPVTITAENAAFHYRKATRLMRIVKLVCMLLFVFIVWSVIRSAHDGSELNVVIMIGLMAALFLPILWYLIEAWKYKPDDSTLETPKEES